MDTYDIYLEDFNKNHPNNDKIRKSIDIINDNDKIIKLVKDAEVITLNGGKVQGSGKHFKVCKLSDGRIVEIHISFGWLYKAYVFNNEKYYRNYENPMNENVYSERF